MIIPSARSVQDSISASGNGDTSIAFLKVVSDAISTAVGTKSNSATVSVSGKQGPDVMATIQDLRSKGYRISGSSTNLTISW